MITTLFFTSLNKSLKKKRKKKKNLTLDQKQKKWNSRWESDDYDPFWNIKSFPKTITELINSGLIPEGASIIDIGCGSGLFASLLANKGFKVLGFDFANTTIERAKNKYSGKAEKLEYFTADATKPLPFKGSFGIGIDRGTFHTIPTQNRPAYVSNISPLIEHAGCLVLIYALRIVKNLAASDTVDHKALLKDHISDLFNVYFEIEEFREVMIESHNRKDTPGFLIILRRI